MGPAGAWGSARFRCHLSARQIAAILRVFALIVRERLSSPFLSLLFTLIVHFLVTVARLARPGGSGAVAAESLAVKQQLLIQRI